jgi:glycosyltransferase involved in cell wall biosynthesis
MQKQHARPRVLFVTAYWPTPDSPSDAVYVREHAKAAQLVSEVRVIHLVRLAAEHGVVDVVQADDDDVPTVRVRYRRLPRPFSYAANWLGLLQAVRLLRRQGFEPQILHVHQLAAALPTLVLGRLLRIPVAYTEHWTIFLPENPHTLSAPMRLAARLALRRADVVLPVSHAWRQAAWALAPQANYRIVHNVVDETIFTPAGANGRSPGATLRLLTVSHLNEGAKGIDLLLRALAELSHERSVGLEIIGSGEGEAAYRKLAAELGISQLVRFAGTATKREIARRMHDADLLVLASRFENSPCTIIESLASGLPVVATDVGGVSELVDERWGVLAAPQSVSSLRAAIEQAAGRIESFDRPAMARAAVASFGQSAVAGELGEVYCALLADRGGS